MIAGPRPPVYGVSPAVSTNCTPRPEIEDPRRVALDQAGNDPRARALIRDLDDCLDLWDISEGIAADDPAEMIRAAGSPARAATAWGLSARTAQRFRASIGGCAREAGSRG